MVSADDRPLILHVLHHLVTGGMENGLVNLINHLPHHRWRHRVLCIEDYSDFRDRILRPDVDVIALQRSKVGTWKLRQRIFAECRASAPAVVHTRNLSGLDALPPAWAAGRGVRVHSEHGWDVDNLDGSRFRPAALRRLHSVFVNRFVAVSKDIESYLCKRVGIHRSRIAQIYNGVDVDRFRPRDAGPCKGLPDGFAGTGTFVIGTVGRLQAVKDQATLLDAAAQLCERRPDLASRLRIAIVGGGPMNDALQSRAAALGVAARTWFAGPTADVAQILRNFDVFVLPSLMEGTSNTLLEAMASGLPLIATGVGGNLELLREGRTGEFFVPGDVPRLVSLIERYADDTELLRRHGLAARASAVADFSLPAMVRNYGELYAKMIEKQAPHLAH